MFKTVPEIVYVMARLIFKNKQAKTFADKEVEAQFGSIKELSSTKPSI